LDSQGILVLWGRRWFCHWHHDSFLHTSLQNYDTRLAV
jgi:hypothetical protein